MKAVGVSAVIVLKVFGYFAELTFASPIDDSSSLSANETTSLAEVVEVLIGRFYSDSDNAVETDGQIVDDFEAWEAPEYIQINCPYYLSGFDDDNRPIWIVEVGRFNIRKLVEEGGEQLRVIEKYAEQAIYRILKSVKLRSRPEEPVTDANFIVDFEDFSLSTISHLPTLSYILHQAKIYRNLIEKFIHKGMAINVNFVAERLIRSVFGSIMEKIEIYGNSRVKWTAALRRNFPANQLPEWYGGNKGYRPL